MYNSATQLIGIHSNGSVLRCVQWYTCAPFFLPSFHVHGRFKYIYILYNAVVVTTAIELDWHGSRITRAYN